MSEGKKVIPKSEKYERENQQKIWRVAPYCRVSTMSDAQEDSYETQLRYYADYANKRADWDLVEIYADQGISATSMRRRIDFLRMIEDCKQGKIDLIITKSISRFARNIVDCVSTCRMLRHLSPPVGVFFETENLNTLSDNSELILSFLAALAQGESEAKSTAVKWGIRKRFAEWIPKLGRTYGFDYNDRMLTPNAQAAVVKQMFEWAADGNSVSTIVERLNLMKIPSPSGKGCWNYASVRYILTNEKYVGDILMQKTVVVDFLDHRSVKNQGREPQYYLSDAIENIVSRETWEKVQRKLGSIGLDSLLKEAKAETIGPWTKMKPVKGA